MHPASDVTSLLLWALLTSQSVLGVTQTVSRQESQLPTTRPSRNRAASHGPMLRASAWLIGSLLLLLFHHKLSQQTLLSVSSRIPLIDTARDPNLKRCSESLNRLQIALIVELCIEIVFWFIVCCGRKGMCYKETHFIGVLRTLYAIPVVVVNGGLLWFGSQGGSCLKVEEVRIAFAELLLYAVLSVLNVISAVLN